MNEIEIIRAQLSTERQHVAEVVNACSRDIGTRERQTSPAVPSAGSATGEFRQACVDYLAAALARIGTDASREALATLEAVRDADALAVESRWRSFLHTFESEWPRRCDALDSLFQRNLSVTRWRAAAGVDADSILEERRLYGRVKAALSPGLALAAPTASSSTSTATPTATAPRWSVP